MFCSQCGADNTAGAKFCAKCGTALALAAPPAPVQEVTTMRGLDSGVAPGAVVTTATPVAGKNPVLAAVLSVLISGLGQVYNGDWKKGLVMFFGAILGFVLTGGVATLAIWLWGIVDAYRVADGKGKVW